MIQISESIIEESVDGKESNSERASSYNLDSIRERVDSQGKSEFKVTHPSLTF